MSKILIITYYYKQKNAMASIRGIKLAKYLAQQGNEVTVLTSMQKDTWTKKVEKVELDEYISEIYCKENKLWRIIFGYLEKRNRKAKENIHSSKLQDSNKIITENSIKSKMIKMLRWIFYFSIAILEDITLFIEMRKEFKKLESPKYDVVIATYPTYGALLMGNYLKSKKKCNTYVADFRDPLYNPSFRNNYFEKKYDEYCQLYTLKKADKVICVTEGIKKGILEFINDRKYTYLSGKISVIYNGYDIDDIKLNSNQVNIEKEKINFVYTGTLYHGKRTVEVLADILQELIQEKKISKDTFVLHYAGPHSDEWEKQLGKYNLEDTICLHGFVSREYSLELQSKADALLLLTWDERGYEGVIPGKLFEYMAYKNIPILAIITGDNCNCEVSRIITESKAGISYEYGNPSKEELKKYVLELFEQNKRESSIVEQYDYRCLSQEYIKKVTN